MSSRPPPTSGFGPELLRGATRASLPALAGILLVAAAWFLAAAVLVTPEAVAEHGQGVLRYGNDDARLMGELLRLRHSPPPKALVGLVGSSTLREGLDVVGVAEGLRERRRCEVDVRDLTAAGLLIWEMHAVMDQIPPGTEGLLVIGISPTALAADPEDLCRRVAVSRFGVESAAFADEVRRVGLEPTPTTGIWAYDHRRLLVSLRSALIPAVRRDSRNRRHRFLGRTFEDPGGRRIARIRTRLDGYAERREEMLGVLSRAVALARRRGPIDVALLEAPRDPGLADPIYTSALLADHGRRLRRFAREEGVAYWDLLDEVGYRPGEVRHYHVSSGRAIRRLTELVTDRIADHLESRR